MTKTKEPPSPPPNETMAETPEVGIHPPQPAPPPPERPDPSGATQGQRQRLETCLQEMQAVLNKYRCKVLPRFNQVIPVGTAGDTIQLQSTWDLGALPDQP